MPFSRCISHSVSQSATTASASAATATGQSRKSFQTGARRQFEISGGAAVQHCSPSLPLRISLSLLSLSLSLYMCFWRPGRHSLSAARLFTTTSAGLVRVATKCVCVCALAFSERQQQSSSRIFCRSQSPVPVLAALVFTPGLLPSESTDCPAAPPVTARFGRSENTFEVHCTSTSSSSSSSILSVPSSATLLLR